MGAQLLHCEKHHAAIADSDKDSTWHAKAFISHMHMEHAHVQDMHHDIHRTPLGRKRNTTARRTRMCRDVWEEADGSQRVRPFILLQPGPTAPLTERG